MSAGYIIYSLDADKFRRLITSPTSAELTAFGKLLAAGLEEFDGEFDEDDPISEWPTDTQSLARIAAQRLALSDWYGDLSYSGKNLWEGVIFGACQANKKFDVGFRVDNDGIYWDVIHVAWKELGVPQGTVNDVALSTFGTRPFRYHPRPTPKKKPWLGFGSGGGDDEYTPMHSMHMPDEVARMRAELTSVGPALKATKVGDARQQYEADLLPAIERIAADGRMLFVQVDT
jgi:hypothetical protein